MPEVELITEPEPYDLNAVLDYGIERQVLHTFAGAVGEEIPKPPGWRPPCDYLDRKFAQKRKPPGESGPEMLESIGTREDDPASQAFDEGIVDVAREEALDKLGQANPDQAEIIRDLLRTDGEGSPDLAERLGRPARQIAVLKHRARKAFATLFAEELKSTVLDLDAFAELLDALEPHLP